MAALSCVRISSAVVVLGALGLVSASGTEAAEQPSEPLAVRTSIPTTVSFGDRFTARVVVLMDRRAVDASRVRVVSPLAPLTQLTPTRVSRFSRGSTVIAAFDLTAACLDMRCVGPDRSRQVALPPVRAEVPTRGGNIASVSQPWPNVAIVGRVAGAELEQARPPFRTNLDAPAVTYRVAPTTLATLLALVALALALVAIGLAGIRLARLLRTRSVAQMTDLERALALARGVEARSPADRRRALGLLARLLRPRESRLAGAASALAWSAPEPAPDSVSSLVEEVAREVDPR